MAIHLQSLVVILTKEFHCSIGIYLMNGEGTNPPRFEFSRKDMMLGIIEQDFISFLEIFFEPPSDHAISSIFLYQVWNSGKYRSLAPLTH